MNTPGLPPESVTPTLIAIFDDREAAVETVKDLEGNGFTPDQVGFAVRGSDVGAGGMITDTVGTKDASGALAGAATGALAGGVLAAAVTMLLPGVGPVIAAGALAAFAGYAAAGAAVGGILGAMIGLGVSEDEAKRYEKLFHEGKAIVAVKGANQKAAEILERHGGYHLYQTSQSPVKTEGVFSEP